jgi:hypothetical protein
MITCPGALRHRWDLNVAVQALVNFGTQRLDFFLLSCWDTLLLMALVPQPSPRLALGMHYTCVFLW